MPTKTEKEKHQFLSTDSLQKHSTLFYLNFYRSRPQQGLLPSFHVQYHLVLLSWKKWGKKNLDEFCQRETQSYFLFNPKSDSPEAREAYCAEIKAFISGL